MKIAIIGGTGVCNSFFMDKNENIELNTPYGKVQLTKGYRGDKEIFFLERHSKGHKLIPSKVNYKGNIYALKSLNVDYIISTAAVGGINNCNVGDFIILNDFIDFTKNRSCTFFDDVDSGVVHVDMTEPYCKTLRAMLIEAFQYAKAPLVKNGTYVCTEGPRFETPAEISMYKKLGADVVGMTNVPEVILARESSLCYATVALVTNYASGISKTNLTHKEVSENMLKMINTLTNAFSYLIDHATIDKLCTCNHALDELNTLK
ncbi:S-methyl-5'-thioinosine phosphorylase [Clostridium lundense]|uniref:S-methyl-5'-thioinosine phosphorylase n=1 Tax=Clostridium lundense TaxID=319475 RepID=UPI0004803280|nr:S-methyl-5'-thioinosine phosphorylase [Clostridium lundense]